MAFPSSPTNGQQAVVGNVTYQYSASNNAWGRVAGSIPNFTATGNIFGGNLLTSGYVSATGNIISNTYFVGNGAVLTGITSISNGTSSVSVFAANSNITVGVNGTSNVVVWANTGEYVSGVVSATGNILGGNVLTPGSISATGNLAIAGSATITGNLNVAGNITFTGADYVVTNDLAIQLANNQTTLANVNGAGLQVGPTGNSLTNWTYNSSANAWTTNVGISATGNVNGNNVFAGGMLSAAGNVYGGGVNTTTAASPPSSPAVGDMWYDTTINVIYRYTYDGVSYFWEDFTGGTLAANATAIINGTSNVNVEANSFVTIGVAGNSNVAVFSTTGASISALSLAGNITTHAILETATITSSAPVAVTNYDIITQAVQYYTANATANVTLNFRGNAATTVNTLLGVGQSTTVALLWTNGATAYYPNLIQVDGTTVATKWQGGLAVSSGSTSAIDVYAFTLVKTAANTFTVLGSQTKFA